MMNPTKAEVRACSVANRWGRGKKCCFGPCCSGKRGGRQSRALQKRGLARAQRRVGRIQAQTAAHLVFESYYEDYREEEADRLYEEHHAYMAEMQDLFRGHVYDPIFDERESREAQLEFEENERFLALLEPLPDDIDDPCACSRCA